MFEGLKAAITTIKSALSTVKNSLATVPNIRGKLTGYSMLTLTQTALNVFGPYMLIKMLSEFNLEVASYETATLVVGGYGLIWSCYRVIPILNNRLLYPLSVHVAEDLSQKVNVKFYKLALEYQIGNSPGRTMERITKAYTGVIQLVPNLFGKIIPTSVEIIAATTILISLYGEIGVGLIGTFGMYTASAVISTRYKAKAKKKENERVFEFYADFHEAFLNYETAHYFSNVKHQTKEFNARAQRFSKALRKTSRYSDNSSLIQTAIAGVGFTGVLLWAAYNTAGGTYNLLDFFMILMYAGQFALPLSEFSSAINTIQTASEDTVAITNFINSKQEIWDKPNAARLVVNPTNAKIEFRNVSFQYNDRLILENFSLTMAPQERVAVVGMSGAGKSTIAKLLFRFYDPTSGNIFINNQNIKDVALVELRRAIGIVPQEGPLFNKTLRENITYGNFAASQQQIDRAIKEAGLEEYISQQPKGLETNVGEMGKGVSGGQKQRIAIARTILKNPPILVYDEATSALDAETERTIQEKLEEVSERRTTLIITHRLNTVVNADKIVYLDGGKIVEQGTFSELMESKGKFYEQIAKYCNGLGINVENIKIPKKEKRVFEENINEYPISEDQAELYEDVEAYFNDNLDTKSKNVKKSSFENSSNFFKKSNENYSTEDVYEYHLLEEGNQEQVHSKSKCTIS